LLSKLKLQTEFDQFYAHIQNCLARNAFERFCETIELSKCALKAKIEEELRKNLEKSSFHKPQTSSNSFKASPISIQIPHISIENDRNHDDEDTSSEDLWYENQQINITSNSKLTNEKCINMDFFREYFRNRPINNPEPMISTDTACYGELHNACNGYKLKNPKKKFANKKHPSLNKPAHALSSSNNLGMLKTCERIFNSKKQFNCHVCSKEFSQLCNLKSHLRIHTGERPYVCEICMENFTQLAHLRYHQKKKHAKLN